jgi:CSLREA domain-containing protein
MKALSFSSRSSFSVFMLLALMASLLGASLTVTRVFATVGSTITVNTTDDQDGLGAECSLREDHLSKSKHGGWGLYRRYRRRRDHGAGWHLPIDLYRGW